MRRILIGSLIALGVLVVAVVAAAMFVDINRYQGRIQADLEKRFNRKIQLGQMAISFVPLGFRVDRLVIDEDSRFETGRAFAQAQELTVSPQFWPLLHGDIQINSFAIQQPQIELVRSREGVWNFSSLGQAPAGADKAGESAARPESSGHAPAGNETTAFSLAELKIVNGQVALTDLHAGAPRVVYDHIDLTVKNYSPGRPFDIAVAANLPGEGTQTIGFEARLGPVDPGHIIATAIDGKLRLAQVSVSSLSRFLSAKSLAGMDGVATGEASIKNAGGTVSSSGSLKLDRLKINGGEIGAASAEFDFLDDLDKEVLTIRKGELKLGSTPLSLTGEMRMKQAPAQIELTVKTSNASIEGLARLAAVLGVSFNPGMKVDGRLTANLHAQGSASQPGLNGTLVAQDLEISGKELRQPVQVKSIELALSPQEIRSNNFAAVTGNTRVEAQFTLSAYATQIPQIDLTLRTDGANVEELLHMATAYGVSAVEGVSGSGSANLDLHATGALKDASTINFSGDGLLRNASFRMPQLAKPLEVRNAVLQFTRNSVALEKLEAALDQTKANGSLTVQNFSAPQLQFALNFDKVNVADAQKLFAGATAPSASATDGAWSVFGTVHAAAAHESMLFKATGAGKMTIGTVVNDQLVLTNLRSDVNLNRGVIRLAPLTADVFGGQESGSITIDTTQEPMLTTLSANFKSVDANKLLSAVSAAKSNIYGPLNAIVNGTYRSGPSEQVLRSMDGTLALDLRNGRIEGFSLIQELGTLGRFLNIPGPAKTYTDVTQLATKFVVKDGVARTDDLNAILDTATVSGAGTVNLLTQVLNMKLTAVLNKEISRSVGGSAVGGYLNAALGNKQGELVMPVIVTGPVQKPKFVPDAEKIAKLKLQNILPTAGDTKGVQDLFQGLFGKPPKKEKP